MNAFRRAFSATCQAFLKKNKFPPRPKINEDEITEVFIKGGGKGGQKINKTNSKVQLKHIPTGIVVDSQFSRSREDNRKRAREILALKLDEMENGETSRAAIVAQYHINKARKKKQRARKRQKEREMANATANGAATAVAEGVHTTDTNLKATDADPEAIAKDRSKLAEDISAKDIGTDYTSDLKSKHIS